MNRVGQFFRAVGARLTEEDLRYIGAYLPSEAQGLFFCMSRADQCHALHVARTAEAMAEGEPVDREFLIRCALLHDVGRTKKDMGVPGKVLAVLLHALAPEMSRAWAGKGAWPGHILHVYYHHPEIGAEKLEKAGFPEEADIVRFHHRPPQMGDLPALRILREADERN